MKPFTNISIKIFDHFIWIFRKKLLFLLFLLIIIIIAKYLILVLQNNLFFVCCFLLPLPPSSLSPLPSLFFYTLASVLLLGNNVMQPLTSEFAPVVIYVPSMPACRAIINPYLPLAPSCHVLSAVATCLQSIIQGKAIKRQLTMDDLVFNLAAFLNFKNELNIPLFRIFVPMF